MDLTPEQLPELPPVPSRRGGRGKWLFALAYVVMGVLMIPFAKAHYGEAATLRWVTMSVLWPIEALWALHQFWHVLGRIPWFNW